MDDAILQDNDKISWISAYSELDVKTIYIEDAVNRLHDAMLENNLPLLNEPRGLYNTTSIAPVFVVNEYYFQEYRDTLGNLRYRLLELNFDREVEIPNNVQIVKFNNPKMVLIEKDDGVFAIRSDIKYDKTIIVARSTNRLKRMFCNTPPLSLRALNIYVNCAQLYFCKYSQSPPGKNIYTEEESILENFEIDPYPEKRMDEEIRNHIVTTKNIILTTISNSTHNLKEDIMRYIGKYTDHIHFVKRRDYQLYLVRSIDYRAYLYERDKEKERDDRELNLEFSWG